MPFKIYSRLSKYTFPKLEEFYYIWTKKLILEIYEDAKEKKNMLERIKQSQKVKKKRKKEQKGIWKNLRRWETEQRKRN